MRMGGLKIIADNYHDRERWTQKGSMCFLADFMARDGLVTLRSLGLSKASNEFY